MELERVIRTHDHHHTRLAVSSHFVRNLPEQLGIMVAHDDPGAIRVRMPLADVADLAAGASFDAIDLIAQARKPPG